MIITIDGPSGTGKTTIAKRVAEELNFTYVDTGAMYRAVTWALLKEGIDLKDLESIEHFLIHFTYDVRIQDGEKRYFVGEEDVTRAIRTQEVSAAVSEVSAMECVRQTLWVMQRSLGSRQSSVFEGRDMGSVVFPEAEVKIFLDASSKVRAQRRLDELREKLPEEAENLDIETMEKELLARDQYDARRKLAPLKRPRGSHRIDTSELTIEEVVEKIVAYYHKKAGQLLPSWLYSKKMHLFYRVVIFLTWLYLKICFRHKVYGLKHYTNRAALIAPNHTSYLDPPIVSSSWPEEVHFLARKGLFRFPIFGRFIRALNSHPVTGDVADVSVFKTLLALLKEGKQVIIFPEGERTTSAQIGEIKPGVGMLLMRSKETIIPTYIHGAREVWGRERKFPKLWGKTACVFGSPIVWESFSHLDKKEAHYAIANALSEAITELKNWYDSGAEGTPP